MAFTASRDPGALSRVLFIRHGRTAWNEAGRIQGHTDIGLDDVGRSQLEGKHLPPEFSRWAVVCSPLKRALETSRILDLENPGIDDRLREMSYGDWEGLTWSEIRARHGDALSRREALGLDFRPDRGESPRELRARLWSWLEELAAGEQPAVAVTHKGIIRMALAIATGWDLVSRAPHRLAWDCAHLFAVSAGGRGLEIERLNLPLVTT